MDLLDSDIFVLDLRFPNDPRQAMNKRLLEDRKTLRATTIFNVLEVCGILSFNLSRESLLKLYAEFGRRYSVRVLFPPESGVEKMSDRIAGIFDKIAQKMTYGDAQILWLAEQHDDIDRLITWNTKDFQGRTHLDIFTPEEWVSASA